MKKDCEFTLFHLFKINVFSCNGRFIGGFSGGLSGFCLESGGILPHLLLHTLLHLAKLFFELTACSHHRDHKADKSIKQVNQQNVENIFHCFKDNVFSRGREYKIVKSFRAYSLI